MQVHPVFYTCYLQKNLNNPLPGQENPPLVPLVINKSEEWEVESVQAVKLVQGHLWYKVKWLGQDKDPKYYTAENLIYSPHLLQSFYLTYPELPGPPEHLEDWLKAYKQENNSYNKLEGASKGSVLITISSRASFFWRGG